MGTRGSHGHGQPRQRAVGTRAMGTGSSAMGNSAMCSPRLASPEAMGKWSSLSSDVEGASKMRTWAVYFWHQVCKLRDNSWDLRKFQARGVRSAIQPSHRLFLRNALGSKDVPVPSPPTSLVEIPARM